MQKNYVYKSVALHIAVVLLCVFDIPFLGSKRNFDEQPPIMVDLENVKISDTTNIPAKAVRGPEKKPATRKEKPVEESFTPKKAEPAPAPKVEEKPKPEPVPEVKAPEIK